MPDNTDPQVPVPQVRSDDEIHLRDVVNLLIRNRWIIAGSLVAVLSLVIAYTRHQIPVFEAVTTIRINEQRTDLPVLDVLQNLSTGSEVETEMEVLRSRSLAEEVVDSLGLQVVLVQPRGVARSAILSSVFVERWAPEGVFRLVRQADGSFMVLDETDGSGLGPVSRTVPGALPGATFLLRDQALELEEILIRVDPFERAVSALRSSVQVARPNRDASIVTVSHQSADTQLVHWVPNALAAHFIARGKEERKTEARSTVGFLQEQIDTLSLQLSQAEEALTGFREVEQVVSLQAEAQAQVTNLSRLQADRNTIEAEREALQSLVSEIEREAAVADPSAPSPYTRLISFPTLLSNNAVSELLRTLNEANAQRSDLLRRRTLQDPDIVALTGRIRDIEAQLRGTALTYLQGLTNQVTAYDRTLAQFASDLERIPAKEVQLARLERERDVLEEVFTVLQNRLQEAKVFEAVEDATVRVVDPAVRPSDPVKPRVLLNLLLGIILGSMTGVAIAFLREFVDDTVHTREDVQTATLGAPVLGMIPRIREAAATARGNRSPVQGELNRRLVAGRDPRNPVSEAYRNLRTNLTFANPDHPPKTIVITSAMPQDGKSTSAANLSITLAQQGIRALLIDADLRRGVLNEVFGAARDPGLTTVLTGKCDLAEAITKIDMAESGTLDFMPTGGYPPNPAEILGSERMRSLIQTLEQRYDLIILDTAPLTAVTDAAVLGTKADGVIMVARASVTEKGALTYSTEQLHNVRATVLGCVINDVDFRRDARYYSSYGKYGYSYQAYYAENQKRQKDTDVAKSEV